MGGRAKQTTGSTDHDLCGPGWEICGDVGAPSNGKLGTSSKDPKLQIVGQSGVGFSKSRCERSSFRLRIQICFPTIVWKSVHTIVITMYCYNTLKTFKAKYVFCLYINTMIDCLFTRCASMKWGFPTTDDAPEQFVL